MLLLQLYETMAQYEHIQKESKWLDNLRKTTQDQILRQVNHLQDTQSTRLLIQILALCKLITDYFDGLDRVLQATLKQIDL